MRRGARTLATAAAVLAGAVPAAHAADLPGQGKDIAYAVQVEGEGYYAYAEKRDYGSYWVGDTIDADFTYKGAIGDGVVFRNTSPFEMTADDLAESTATGEWAEVGSIPVDPPCPAHPGDSAYGPMRFLDAADLPGGLPALDGDVHLWLRPFDSLNLPFDCGALGGRGVELAQPLGEDAWEEDGRVKLGHNPFDIPFSLPRDIIGMGYIEQRIPIQSFETERCPRYLDVQTTHCRLAWQATVKLTKLWEKPTEAPPPPVTTPTTTAPLEAPELVPLVPAEPTKPATDTDDLELVPLVPAGKASLASNASKATFAVSCPAGCSGTAALTAGTGATARAAKAKRKAAKPLARTSFKVAKGTTKRVTLKLGAKARKAVKKARGARIAIRMTSGGTTTTKTLALRLKKPRR